MTDEEREQLMFVEALEKRAYADRRRGHAPFWNAGNKSQSEMEVGATKDWAEEMNRRGHSMPSCKIVSNRDDPPDVFAEMDGKKIGVEVTELVDNEAIRKHPKNPRYEGSEHFVENFLSPMPPQWPLDKFQEHLRNIVEKKDKRGKDSSLSKQFLLIVTNEAYLLDDKETLPKYLKTTKLKQPRNFDGVYLMGSYMPNPDGKGHGCYPVFDVPLYSQ